MANAVDTGMTSRITHDRWPSFWCAYTALAVGTTFALSGWSNIPQLFSPEGGSFIVGKDQLPPAYRQWARMTVVGRVLLGHRHTEPVLSLIYVRGWGMSAKHDGICEQWIHVIFPRCLAASQSDSRPTGPRGGSYGICSAIDKVVPYPPAVGLRLSIKRSPPRLKIRSSGFRDRRRHFAA